jgi:predicted Ser/Thr protein kinase
MSVDGESSVAELFDRLRSLPQERRAGVLDAVPGLSNQVRRTVLSLLEHDSPTEEFMGRPVEAASRTLLRPLAAPAGGVIGGYQFLRELGRGGFGVVYLAEQQSPRRRVALKVMSRTGPEADDRRIRQEANALARLDHPAIARVYECGSAPELGIPAYLAMEYVEGVSLDTFLRSRDLSARERLGLLASLADAIEHAHVRGVLHRDLSPKNVLVLADGAIKLIDFGLARDRDRGASEAVTLTGTVLGTLRYMSPEQCRGEKDGIDTRSDLFSLGVIAYECLTGDHPFARAEDSLAGLLEGLLSGKARAPSAVSSRLTRDFDAVLLKAIERDPDRRFLTAGKFAQDLRNLAENRPVLARRAGWPYRGRKFVERNLAPVAAAAVVLAGVAIGVGQLVVTEAKKDQARVQALNALDTVVTYMLAPLAPRIGTLEEREALLAKIGPDIETISRELGADPRAMRVRAAYLVMAGDVARERSRLTAARDAYAKAVEVMDALASGVGSGASPAPDAPGRGAQVEGHSVAIVKLGDALQVLDQPGPATACYQRALLLDERAAEASADPRTLSNLFWSCLRLAGRPECTPGAAEEYRARAGVIAERLRSAAPRDWRTWEAIAQHRIVVAITRRTSGRIAEADSAISEAVAATDQLVRIDPSVLMHHATRLHAVRMAVFAALSTGDVPRAEELIAAGMESRRLLAGAATDPFVWFSYTSPFDAARAALAESQGRYADALGLWVERAKALDHRLALVPGDQEARTMWIDVLSSIPTLLPKLAEGEGTESRAALELLVVAARERLGSGATVVGSLNEALSRR